MDYIDPHLLAQARFKNKLSNQLLISKLSNEELNKMMAKHEEKNERYQKLVNESTERNNEILKQIYNERLKRSLKPSFKNSEVFE